MTDAFVLEAFTRVTKANGGRASSLWSEEDIRMLSYQALVEVFNLVEIPSDGDDFKQSFVRLVSMVRREVEDARDTETPDQFTDGALNLLVEMLDRNRP